MNFPFGSGVLDAASRLLVPVILLFAVYVVAHGHDSPGGGFQGGALLAAGLILVKLIRGRRGGWEFDTGQSLALACGGVALYSGIGLDDVVFGQNYLDHDALPILTDPIANRVLATLGVEIGVALTVSGVILLVFDALAGWGEDEPA